MSKQEIIKKPYWRAAEALKRAKNIALCVHMYPDGDALGSMTALSLCLEKLKKRVTLFSPTELPHRYGFLPHYHRIRLKPARNEAFDLAVAIDCASYRQMGDLYESVFLRSAQTLEIDHHVFRKSFTDISLIDDHAAAVGEMVYCLSRFLKVKIDRDMAEAMLVSIIVETGSFRLPSVSVETFRICSDLITKGVDYYRVVEKSYWSRTKAEAKLLGLCLSRLKFLKGGALATSFVSIRDLRRLEAREEDVDPIADQIRTLKDVKIALLFREVEGKRWRVSLRSKGRINVGEVAREFGGGGHPDVAGCFLERKEKEKNRLISRLSQLLRVGGHYGKS